MRGFKHFFAQALVQPRRLSVRGIGVQEAMPPCIINRPRGTGDYLLMYFYDPVWIASSELPGQYPAGTMMVWSPGRWQYYGNRAAGYRHSWMHCDGEIIQNVLRDSGLPVDEPFHLADGAIAERALLAIYEELIHHASPDAMIIRNLLDNMVREMVRAIHPAAVADAIPQTFLAVRNLLESDYDQRLRLGELARRTDHSISRFCALFRQYFGAAPHEYQLRHRMHQAAYLLRDQNLAVKEVARSVGYRDPFAFSKLFKKHFGSTPSAYRHREPGSAPNNAR